LVLLKRIHDESSAAESDALRTCIKVGCAFHHSGVSIAGRKHLEEAFKRGVLHVMFCTSTLSVGVNLPASVVIVRSAMVGIEQLTPNAFKVT
jgi:POLQ-like helicase